MSVIKSAIPPDLTSGSQPRKNVYSSAYRTMKLNIIIPFGIYHSPNSPFHIGAMPSLRKRIAGKRKCRKRASNRETRIVVSLTMTKPGTKTGKYRVIKLIPENPSSSIHPLIRFIQWAQWAPVEISSDRPLNYEMNPFGL